MKNLASAEVRSVLCEAGVAGGIGRGRAPNANT